MPLLVTVELTLVKTTDQTLRRCTHDVTEREVDLDEPQQAGLECIVEAFETKMCWLSGDAGWLANQRPLPPGMRKEARGQEGMDQPILL